MYVEGSWVESIVIMHSSSSACIHPPEGSSNTPSRKRVLQRVATSLLPSSKGLLSQREVNKQ